MLRSNTKDAERRIIQYLRDECEEAMDNLNIWNYENKGEQRYDILGNDKHFANYVLKEFRRSKDPRILNEQDAFIEWTRGVPFRIWYEDYTNAVNVVGDLFDETEQERNRFTNDDAATFLMKVAYMWLCRVANRA